MPAGPEFASFEETARDVYRTHIDPAHIRLDGQTAVVTGGGAGIGLGVALALARFGSRVAVLDVVPERAAAAQAALGDGSRAFACDVADEPRLRAVLAEAADQLGPPTILVNNAGGVRPGPFVSQPSPSIRRHLDLNLMAALVATQVVAGLMIEVGRGGSIVNVASIEASRAAPGYAVYGACKAALVSLTRTLAVELSGYGIRVNCISPDRTTTPGLRGNLVGPVDPASWGPPLPDSDRVVPLAREGLVDECAGAVVWLCSRLASYVTGVDLPVDGGTAAAGGWVRAESGGWRPGR